MFPILWWWLHRLNHENVFRQAHVQKLGSEPPNWFRIECDKLRRTILDRDSAEWKTLDET